MIKRIVHLVVAITFPIYVFLDLLFKIVFTDKGLGNDWIPETTVIYDILRGK